MYKYGHKTRGHPRLQRLLAFVFALVMLVAMVPADLAKADAIEHTHIWADKYDSSNHWKYCTVCGAIKDKEAHTFTDHWYIYSHACGGKASTRTCHCGYSYIHVPQHVQDNTIYSSTYNVNVHYKRCKNCGAWTWHESCRNENGPLSCKNPGKCSICGGVWPENRHFANNSGGICNNCHQRLYTITNIQKDYSSDYKSVDVSFTVKPVNSSVKITGNTMYDEGDANVASWTGNIIQNPDNTATIKWHLNLMETKPTAISIPNWRYDNIKVNGQASYVCEAIVQVWMDHTAPVVSEIKQTDQKSHNGYATIKQLDISGTEDYANAVKLSIIDKETGKKLVDKATTAVTDNKWSYTCTPPLEANDSGRTYIVQVEDINNNVSSKEFTIYKTDGTAPQIESPLSYTDWTNTAKTITLTVTDYGSGDVQASLGDQTHYQACTKTADGKYQITYTISDDIIGNKTYKLYLRDGLGNTDDYDLIIGNIDKNTYNISYNLNGGAMSGQKTSYTVTDSFTLPTPTKTGYTFTGWTGNNGATAQKTVTVSKYTRENLSYTANWSANNYYITFNGNGGSLNVTDSSIVKNNDGTATAQAIYDTQNYNLLGMVPTRQGFTFKGFYDAPSGGIQVFKPYNSSICISVASKYYNENIWKYTGNVTLYAQWTPNVYTNNISHWLRGFKNAEGNNGSGDAFHLAETYFSAAYKSSFVMDSSRATQIPNGCYVNPSETALFWEDGVHWSSAIYGTITQKAYNMVFQYGYRPYDYSITYNLNGGTNNNANPSTYTVLYGVSLKAPTRAGYTFTGWYDENGNKITGINEGCNAKFSSADDLYTKLAARTTGNRTLTAHWSYNPVSVKVPQVLTGDHTGKSQFRVKCDDFKAGNIKISVPNSFPYKQTGKADVTASITSKSGNNTITPTNKVCVYNITTTNGLSAGCWQGSFNIGLTLTKE